jgi:hypothetical protein
VDVALAVERKRAEVVVIRAADFGGDAEPSRSPSANAAATASAPSATTADSITASF